MTVAAQVKARGAERLRERARAQLLLDANADMPVRPEALDAYLDCAGLVAHPREAARRLVRARETIADTLGCTPDELVFTSGGTEADAVALDVIHGGARPLAVSSIEHAAVARTALAWSRKAGTALSRVAVGRSGVVDLDGLEVLPAGVGVSVVAASNETGALQPVPAIALRVRARGGLVHTDAAQLPGRAPCDVRTLDADVVSFSAHKIGAPAGLGLVVVRNGLPVTRPSSASSDHAASIVAFATALTLVPSPAQQAAIAHSRDTLEAGLCTRLADVWFVAREVPRLVNTSCVGFTGCDGDAVMMALDVRGIAVSTGSACSSGSIEPSPILLGMGLSPREAKSTIRISLPRALTNDELEHVLKTITDVVTAARAMPI